MVFEMSPYSPCECMEVAQLVVALVSYLIVVVFIDFSLYLWKYPNI